MTDHSEELEEAAKLEEIVKRSIAEEALITQDLYKKAEPLSWKEKISDQITFFSGSWTFIILLFMGIFGWMMIMSPYDPYPFILLNLAISVICVMQNPFILMNQWSKEKKDAKRAENEYLVNMKAEIEIRAISDKLDIIMKSLKKIKEKQDSEKPEKLEKHPEPVAHKQPMKLIEDSYKVKVPKEGPKVSREFVKPMRIPSSMNRPVATKEVPKKTEKFEKEEDIDWDPPKKGSRNRAKGKKGKR